MNPNRRFRPILAGLAVVAAIGLAQTVPDDVENWVLEQFEDKLTVEKWQVRSCGQTSSYEVMLSTSPKGGTDVMVMNITDPAGPVEDFPETGAGDIAAEPDVPAGDTQIAEQAADETTW